MRCLWTPCHRLAPSTRMERWALRAGVSLRQAYAMRRGRDQCGDYLAHRLGTRWAWRSIVWPGTYPAHDGVMEHLRDRSYADWERAVATSRRLGVSVAAARIRDVLDDIYSSEFLGGEAKL